MHNAGQSIIVSLMRLIHITDPHLSSLDDTSFLKLRGKRQSGYLSWFKNRRFEHRREVLDSLIDSTRQHNPDLLVLTGDLVHIGLESEIKEAAQWLQSLGPPEKVILVPGNHDNYAADSLDSMYRYWRDYLPESSAVDRDYTSGYPFVRKSGDARFTGVNSSCVTRIFSATGTLGDAQLEQLETDLGTAETRHDFHCLLIHHPPVPGITRRRKALTDAGALAAVIERHQPQLVLYGHIHINREDRLGETRMYCTASASSAEHASYRIFDINPEDSGWQCETKLMSLDRSGGSFRLVSEDFWQTGVCASQSNTGQSQKLPAAPIQV